MLPRICIACGEPMKERAAENPNICNACSCEVVGERESQSEAVEPRMGVSEKAHRPRRRSPVIGDHSHERKTAPTLPRRKH